MQPRRFLWMYCLGHAGVEGNDLEDRLVGKATIASGFSLGRSEVLRSLRHSLQEGTKARASHHRSPERERRAQRQGHHAIDRLEERGGHKAKNITLSIAWRGEVGTTKVITPSIAWRGEAGIKPRTSHHRLHEGEMHV